MHPKNSELPTILVREAFTHKPFVEGGVPPEPCFHWHVFVDRNEAMQYIKCSPERTGFGQDYAKVEFTIYQINFTKKVEIISPPPVTLLDVASELGGHGVKIGLKGKGYDPQSVFWDSRNNTFVVVKPSGSVEGDKRIVSDQGVALMSINGIGEIRWTVFATQGLWPENKEAIDHFGLTWDN